MVRMAVVVILFANVCGEKICPGVYLCRNCKYVHVFSQVSTLLPSANVYGRSPGQSWLSNEPIDLSTLLNQQVSRAEALL